MWNSIGVSYGAEAPYILIPKEILERKALWKNNLLLLAMNALPLIDINQWNGDSELGAAGYAQTQLDDDNSSHG